MQDMLHNINRLMEQIKTTGSSMNELIVDNSVCRVYVYMNKSYILPPNREARGQNIELWQKKNSEQKMKFLEQNRQFTCSGILRERTADDQKLVMENRQKYPYFTALDCMPNKMWLMSTENGIVNLHLVINQMEVINFYKINIEKLHQSFETINSSQEELIVPKKQITNPIFHTEKKIDSIIDMCMDRNGNILAPIEKMIEVENVCKRIIFLEKFIQPLLGVPSSQIIYDFITYLQKRDADRTVVFENIHLEILANITKIRAFEIDLANKKIVTQIILNLDLFKL